MSIGGSYVQHVNADTRTGDLDPRAKQAASQVQDAKFKTNAVSAEISKLTASISPSSGSGTSGIAGGNAESNLYMNIGAELAGGTAGRILDIKELMDEGVSGNKSSLSLAHKAGYTNAVSADDFFFKKPGGDEQADILARSKIAESSLKSQEEFNSALKATNIQKLQSVKMVQECTMSSELNNKQQLDNVRLEQTKRAMPQQAPGMGMGSQSSPYYLRADLAMNGPKGPSEMSDISTSTAAGA